MRRSLLIVALILLCACETPSKVTPTFAATTTPKLVVAATITHSPALLCVAAETALNLRSGPGVQFDLVTQLGHSAQVQPTGTSVGKWIYVHSGTFTGWVNSDFVGACQ